MKKWEWLKPYLYCLFISFLFLMICSKNSFLYKMNDWVDANAFFTVGKGMVRGVVPYQQLFEQKGPLLYFIYGIGSIISYQSFFGVFVLEVIFFSIFLYYSYKIALLFIEKEKSYLLLLVFTLCIVTLKSFSHGGSAEEFCLPLITIGIYYMARYLRKGQLKNIDILISGVLAGCVLWIKYTLLGFWFSWMMCVFFFMIFQKQYKRAFQSCLLFLLGMGIATVPWIIYFTAHNALTDMINVYFLVNMNAYPHKVSFLIKLTKSIKLILLNLFGNPIFFIGIVLSIFIIIIDRKKWGYRGCNLFIIICLLFTALSIYIGGTNFHYYPLALCPFLIIGFILFFKKIELNNQKNIFFYIITLLVICIISAYYTSPNTEMMKYEKEDYAQYEFANIIKQKKEFTILNYGFLDGGFYFTTNSIPEYYYFMKNNIPYENYPEMMDEQKRYIEEKKPNFVIAKDSPKLKSDPINQYYRVIKIHNQKYQNKYVKYVLYERRE